MTQRRPASYATLTLMALLVTQAGCSIKATLDSTSDTLSNFLSSTSGQGWLTEDGLVREEMKPSFFVAVNWANLQQDVSRSQGEYLQAFEQLLAIPDDQRAAFREEARQHLPLLDQPGPNLVAFTKAMTASADQRRAGRAHAD